MPESKNSLSDLLYDIKRIAEHREKLSEKRIQAMYRTLSKNLDSFIADGYKKYADKDGRFYTSYLDAQNKKASFLQEIVDNVDFILPKVKNEIMNLVNETYDKSYKGMIESFKKADTTKEFEDVTKDIDANPYVLKQAVNNNIGKLTLNSVMEKHRQEITYQLQKELSIGLMQGFRYEKMAKRISERVNVSYNKAMNITRTETHRNIEGGFMDCAEHIQEGLGGSDLIYAATWRTMKDERVRPNQRRKTKKGWVTRKSKNGANHQMMEGVTVKAGELFDLGGGVKAKAPSQSGVAAHDCNCRCFLEYNLMTVEEFAKATGQTVEEVRKKYNIGGEKPKNKVAKVAEENKNDEDVKDDIINFTPAKTIEEAENYAKKFISDDYSPTFKNQAIYKGLSLEHANEINSTLEELFTKYDIPKIRGIKTISPTSSQGKKVFSSVDTVAAYNYAEKGIFINKNILKDIKSLEEYNKKSDEAFKLVLNNIDKLNGTQKELALTYKTAGRAIVGSGSVKDYIIHEMGHHVEWSVLDVKTNNLIGNSMRDFAPKISGYANASKSEYIAESFVAYIKGERNLLDTEFVKYLDGKRIKSVDKISKSGIIKVSPTKVIEGHSPPPIKSAPNDLIDHNGQNGKVKTRAFYDNNGNKKKDINTDNHNNPKNHPYGKNGEHAHDYKWENNKIVNRNTRELTDIERKENGDIL